MEIVFTFSYNLKYLILACCGAFSEVLRQVQDLDPPGRFLRKNGSGNFVEVHIREAREKVCQTLRDAVSDANAALKRNEKGARSSDREEDQDDTSDDDDEEEDEQMPPLPIDGKPKMEKPINSEHSKRNIRSRTLSVSPDKKTSRHVPVTVTPTNQAASTSSSFATASPKFTNDSTQPMLFSVLEAGYDAYNYLSRVGTHDDFDLFDGQLIESAKNDEVFASVRL